MAATSLNRVRGTTGLTLSSSDADGDLVVPPAAETDVHDLAMATETAAAAAVATLDRPSLATDTVVRWFDDSGE